MYCFSVVVLGSVNLIVAGRVVSASVMIFPGSVVSTGFVVVFRVDVVTTVSVVVVLTASGMVVITEFFVHSIFHP